MKVSTVTEQARDYGYFDAEPLVCNDVNCTGDNASWYIKQDGSVHCTECHGCIATIEVPKSYA